MPYPLKFFPKKKIATAFGDAEISYAMESSGRILKLLRIDDSLQSATYLGKNWAEPTFEYIRAFDHIFDAQKQGFTIRNILMIGGGGFSWPKHAIIENPQVRLDVCEIDSTMVDIARDNFYLERLEKHLAKTRKSDRLSIHINEGLDYLEHTAQTFDSIINDSFKASEQSDELLDSYGVSVVKSRLNQAGIYAINVVLDMSKSGAYAMYKLIDVLKSYFSHISIVDATDHEYGGAENHVVLATDGNYSFSGCIPYLEDI